MIWNPDGQEQGPRPAAELERLRTIIEGAQHVALLPRPARRGRAVDLVVVFDPAPELAGARAAWERTALERAAARLRGPWVAALDEYVRQATREQREQVAALEQRVAELENQLAGARACGGC